MEEAPQKTSPLATLGLAVILAAILLVAVYGLAHASIRPVHPEQKTPKGHFGTNCGLCHSVSATAQLVE